MLASSRPPWAGVRSPAADARLKPVPPSSRPAPTAVPAPASSWRRDIGPIGPCGVAEGEGERRVERDMCKYPPRVSAAGAAVGAHSGPWGDRSQDANAQIPTTNRRNRSSRALWMIESVDFVFALSDDARDGRRHRVPRRATDARRGWHAHARPAPPGVDRRPRAAARLGARQRPDDAARRQRHDHPSRPRSADARRPRAQGARRGDAAVGDHRRAGVRGQVDRADRREAGDRPRRRRARAPGHGDRAHRRHDHVALGRGRSSRSRT